VLPPPVFPLVAPAKAGAPVEPAFSRGVFVTLAFDHSSEGPALSTSISMTVRFWPSGVSHER
jgi:hypothetical protein